MSLHKLTAGSGYDYLTRQVAALDATEKGHTSLASYYTAKGEAPGRWVGAGLASLDGLDAGDIVTAEQMKALFAYGFHPLADQRLAALADGATVDEARTAQRLGTPYKVFDNDVPPFQIEVARRIEALNSEHGLPTRAAASLEDRARIRSEVAAEFFEREHGRSPTDARELAATVAKLTRPKTTAVAGYDLTFSPVKSVSTLWAVADPSTAAKIERAHDAAVADALAFIEREALFTRTGTNGVRQVETRGLVATAFTHRDSRAGDPDLHTHVAVANKVQTADEEGRWLAIDGRLIYKATVAASEVYNSALEQHLNGSLGVRFTERADTDPRKRPVREIVGVPAELAQRWSSRRASIAVRKAELTRDFQATHGRPPTPVEAIQLAQQATLETRDAKHEPRSLEEQRTTWAAEAAETLGGIDQVDAMVQRALSPSTRPAERVDAAWIDRAARRVVGQVQQRRATWQSWHLTAEAERQVRRGDVSPEQRDAVVQLVVDGALERSTSLGGDRDPISDPSMLRRRDGSSVYTVHRAELYTSAAILAAEQRIVAAGGSTDGKALTPDVVDVALLESAANGIELNAGQATLVRGMATSGARVQLGIAAAGTGKTTAMSVLTRAWEDAGGNVIGLAPSAAAAAALREQTGSTTDTLAKLVDELGDDHGGTLSDAIGPDTLVLVDEAGMADTLTLDQVISHAIRRGASVRLIGDDQQLAAIGAGGVLRDLEHTHGALRLSELMRFADPAEAAATLALRDGQPEAIGYYLDAERVHVGDLATLTDDVFTAWQHDRANQLDSIMLAPTRDLVAELNSRARAARTIAGDVDAGRAVRLSDGNEASVGDVVLTRHNDRRLRISATDWVKNGDRWTVTAVNERSLDVVHTESGLRATLPADYVAAHTELGYASTVHGAQGLSVDSSHALVTGDEARQQFYVSMTRGRQANHAYLVVASDGDPHELIRPETTHPRTATDALERILARDGAPQSATSMAATLSAPTVQLGQATARYTDALTVAAGHLIGAERAATIDAAADQAMPGIADEPAWPALRAHLLLIEAQGRDAVSELEDAVAQRDLDGVQDRAAVIDWRLDPSGHRDTSAGPLPWLPAVPRALAEHPQWGPYLAARAERVQHLAEQVRADVDEHRPPVWARQSGARLAADAVADAAIWRAATEVEEADRRLTGPRQLQKAAALYQRSLNERLNAGRSPALTEWGPRLDSITPRRDTFTLLLAERLATISRAGVDAAGLLARAAGEGPLPDDHAAAALWWRINRHLSPVAALDQTAGDGDLDVQWKDLLIDQLGVENAAAVTGSTWWPTLAASVEHAVARGWNVVDLVDAASTTDLDDVDLAQAMIWRISLLTSDPTNGDEPPPPHEDYLPPDDLDDAFLIDLDDPSGTVDVDEDLQTAAAARALLDPVDRTEQQNENEWRRGIEAMGSPVSSERILQINELAAAWFEQHLYGSWSHEHLAQRLGVDIAGDDRFRPGHAPAGWTNLTDHLRGRGVSDAELLAAGVAKQSARGRVYDRFRDRLVLPVIVDGKVLGFVGRRHPDATDDVGPKYLNTPETIVFHKSAQLYGVADSHMATGAIPVRVEGPLDALAVTIASAGAWVGVAPLGTSMTAEQAAQLAALHPQPVIANDGDLAGRIANERDYWLLAPHLVEPRTVALRPGQDPASILEEDGPRALVTALHRAGRLSDTLIAERLDHLEDHALVDELAAVIATQEPATWEETITRVTTESTVTVDDLRRATARAAARFNDDPARTSSDHMSSLRDVRQRIENAAHATADDRWAALGRSLDPRLTTARDWPVTAATMQELHDRGIDVEAVTRAICDAEPLSLSPARDLRARLSIHLDDRGASPTPESNSSRPRNPETPQRGLPQRGPRR